MNVQPYYGRLGLIGFGAVLWIAGLILAALFPIIASACAVLATVGQVIFWIGVAVLVISLLIGLFRGTV